MTFPALLNLHHVSVRYADHLAVDRLSLSIAGGEIFGLIGPNGSGKSSTLSVVAGSVDPLSGLITVNGVTRRDHAASYAAQIGLVPQDPALYEELSVRDNLYFFGSLYGLVGGDLRRRTTRALGRLGLTKWAGDLVRTLSGGMQRRVNVACALLHDPNVLLLDEPSAALDLPSRDALFATLSELRDEGRAIVLTTHLLEEAELWCDRVGVLQQGRLVALGTPRELARSPLPKVVLYGHLREHLSLSWENDLRDRLEAEVELEVTGRRIRLSAEDCETLGRSLALLLAEGIVLDSFGTPPARLERLMDGTSFLPRSETCDVK